MISILAVIALGFASPANGQLRVQTFVDDDRVDIAPIAMNVDEFCASLNKLARVVLGNTARISLNSKDSLYEVRMESRLVLKFPTSAKAGRMATVLSQQPGVGQRFFELYDWVRPLEPGDDVPVSATKEPMVSIKDFATATGCTYYVENNKIALLTPGFWGETLGIDPEVRTGATFARLDLVPRMGITPPASNFCLWLTPNRETMCQVYVEDDGTYDPVFGMKRGQRTQFIDVDKASAVRVTPDDDLHVSSQHTNFEDGRLARYAAVIIDGKALTDDPSTEENEANPVTAINMGLVPRGRWCVVGIQQRLMHSTIDYGVATWEPGISLSKFMAKNNISMDAELIRTLNGVYGKLTPKQCLPMLYVKGMSGKIPASTDKYEVAGMRVIRPGENLEDLCAAWGIDEDTFYDYNTELDSWTDIAPGDLVYVVKRKGFGSGSKGVNAKAPSTDLGRVKSNAILLDETFRKTDYRVDRLLVNIVGEVDSFYKISLMKPLKDGRQGGFVPKSMIVPLPGGKSGPPIDPATLPSNNIARLAISEVGTPYDWGGNSLERGIDCSHFVAKILSLAGRRAPSAPVVNQEDVGQLVHCRKGASALINGKIVENLPASLAVSTNLGDLRTGDRLICQKELSKAQRTRHTALYIGPLRYQGKTYQHAVVHAKNQNSGVVLEELKLGPTGSFRNYKFARRDAR